MTYHLRGTDGVSIWNEMCNRWGTMRAGDAFEVHTPTHPLVKTALTSFCSQFAIPPTRLVYDGMTVRLSK